MQKKLVLLLALSAQMLSAQNFTEAPQPQSFLKMDGCAAAFADIDNDGDPDLLFDGLNSASINFTRLHVNDGQGHFTLVNGTTFRPYYRGAIAFADVDNDNDLDVLMSGFSISITAYTELYINNGQGNFTVSNLSSFVGVGFSSIAFADVDQDNDQDVLLSGEQTNGPQTTKLYLNNGVGVFTEALSESFVGLTYSAVALVDVDNDSDPDALISGADNTYSPTTLLYFNDGQGHFTESTTTSFAKLASSTIAFADIDNDNDQDFLITGRNALNIAVARLYKNNGQGQFSQVNGTPFVGVIIGSIAFMDADNDGDKDVLIAGNSDLDGQITKLYVNDGQGQFSLLSNTPFIGMDDGAIAIADIDLDSDLDVFITGRDQDYDPAAKLYFNNSVTATIDFESANPSLSFSTYPNPTRPDQVDIKLSSETDNLIKINLFSFDGQLRISREELVMSGVQHISLDLTQVEKGVYWLELNDGIKSGVVKLVVY